MAVESQQGGSSYTHLGSQPDDDTLVDDIQKLSRIKRAFVEHSLEPSGELRRSDSIRGSVFPGKSQSGKIGGTARIVTEVFRNNMLEYVQGILNADPATESDDIANTDDIFDGSVTFVATTPLVLEVIKTGTAGTDQILILDADLPTYPVPPADTGLSKPSRLRITVAAAVGTATIVGKRKYGLGKYDLAPVTEDVTMLAGVGLTVNHFVEIDKITFNGSWADRSRESHHRRGTRITPNDIQSAECYFRWLVNAVSDRKRITYWADGRSVKRTV